jgi:hypothetical protein
MSSEMDKIISAVAWPCTLLLNMMSLPPFGTLLSYAVSMLAIIHYGIIITKSIRKKDQDKE